MTERGNNPVSHSDLFKFKVVSSGKRDQILETVRQSEVSLGMVDPTSGRYQQRKSLAVCCLCCVITIIINILAGLGFTS